MKKGDKIVVIIVAIMIVATSVGIYVYKFLHKSDEKIAIIKKEDEVIRKINLDEVTKPQEIRIDIGENDYNIIRVEKGRIRFIEATCYDEICVKSGWLSHVGENATCLPHKLMIVIEGENKEVDDVTY